MLDLETMEFEAGPTMEEARVSAAVALDVERVLVIGGGGIIFDFASTEILGAADK